MDNPIATPPRRRVRPGRAIALALAVTFVTMLPVVLLRARHGAQERDALHRLWLYNTTVLFEGGEFYENPRCWPAEWSEELARNWFDNLTAARPTHLVFVRFTHLTSWKGRVVDDGDIPKLIDILRELPTIRQVQFDWNFTPAGRATLEKALPNVKFTAAPSIP